MRKVEDITDRRRERPEQEEIRRIANMAAAQARVTDVSAIAVVTVLNGGKTYSGAFCGLSRAERMLLVGELEALKQEILSGD